MMIMMHEKLEHSNGAAGGGTALTCEQFQAHMPEFMGSGHLREHEHIKTCARCSALIEELEYIAEMAKGLMPVYEPPDSLWDKIAKSLHRTNDDEIDPGVLKMVALKPA